ncbi:DUF3429 domain-containing protein [Thalassotalea sp. PLHSN55]|uniref:DUF3429 domain-containing protein n=1 Tax=Thalassotalea sp. PLHSN55 TaxID=3435888 RepID=UPI003F86D466
MKTWQWLGYLGLIPFIACLWLTTFPLDNVAVDPQQGFVFYSAIILSFIAGTLWQKDHTICKENKKSEHQVLNQLEQHRCALPSKQIVSNVFCLLAFGCLLLPIFYGLLILPLGYLTLLLAEYVLYRGNDQTFTKSYFLMRFTLTVLVTSLHCIALLLWF